MNILYINKHILISFVLCFISFLGSATTYTVTSELDDGSAGTLRNVINQLNNSGTTGSPAANNTININIADGTTIITLASNLPVIRNGVTINGPSGGITISGNNQYRLFATFQSSLTLSNLILQDGLALGGNGNGGGGGGMGAGGGVYIDYGQALNVSNTAIIGCFAQGGNGSNGYQGGGGGASWSIAADNGTTGSNGSSGSGGGDYEGVGNTGGPVAYSGTYLGYGGGDGGSDGSTGTAGVGGGNNGGANGISSNGGTGGYCGGGGGASDSTNNSAGGGGGNGGGNGAIGVFSGGGGGGYGSGGSGVVNTLGLGGGGGGGFGGGGGGGSATSINGSAGGGGGGFGGGGGSGSATIAAAGGNFGGAGAISGVGLGGYGAGIGGAIFVSDSAILQIGDLGSSVLSNLNGTQNGTGGGSGYANDVFLFQGAQVQFVGSTDATIAFAIQSDTNAPVGHLDGGVRVNVSNNATITMGNVLNNYQGGTTIQNGTLVISEIVPAVGDINVNSNGTLTLEVANGITAGTFTNSGAVNIEALFTPSNFTNFTNNNAIYAVGPNGSIGGNVTATGSLTVGQNSLRTAFPNNLTTGNAIAFTSINVHNTSSIATTGAGSITGNLYLLGLGNFSGNNISGSMLTIGQDSFSRLNRVTLFNATQNIAGFPTINVNAGSFNTNGNIISSVDTAFNIGSEGTATFDTVVTGLGALNINGSLYSAVANSIGLNGLISIGGTLNVLENLSLNNTINCSGNLIISSSKNLTINDNLYVFGNADVSGDIIGGGGSSLIIGEDSTSATYPNTNSTINSDINNIPTINVKYGSVTTNGTITGVTNSFNIDSGATGTFNGIINAPVAATNAGTLVAGNTLNVNSYTSTGTTNFVINDATIITFINSAGVIDFGTNSVGVSFNWLDAIAGNMYQWTLASGSSISPVPVQVIPPHNTIADTWNVIQTATDLQISLTKGQLNPTTPIIGPIINTMSLDPLNPNQFILVNALGNALTQDELDTYVTQLIPDLNSSVVNIRKQDAVFRQVGHRISAQRDNVALNEITGFVAGDIGLNKAFWIGPFGSFANQAPKDNNFGYRAYSGGIILGIDVEINDRNLLGIAYARSTTTVQTKISPGVQSRSIGYHILLYGNHFLDKQQQSYLEWLASGATNANSGNRRILITGNVFNVNSNFDGYQGGFLVNYGHVFKYNSCLDIIPYGTMQYNFIHTPPYYETTSSPAATYVDNGFNNVLMLGLGTKAVIKTNLSRMYGRTTLGAVIGYDVISSDQITTSNFVSGSAAFTFVTATEKLSLNLDADCTFKMNYGTQLQLVYEFQIRQGYTANAITAKFKFPF